MAKGKTPYLGVDFDVLEKCGPCGASCGLKEEQVFMALGKLWRFCWREQTEFVTTTHVTGFFYGINACESLLSFGFIAASPNGWRVKGADRWLFVQKARSDNGKANAGNLNRGTKKASGTPPGTLPATPPPAGGAPRHPPGTPSGTPPGSAPALTATSDKRPATDLKEEAPVSRNRQVSDGLVEVFQSERGEAYGRWSDADGVALPRLLKRSADNRVILDRWRKALRLGTKYPGCSTIAQLDAKWRDLSAPDTPTKGSAATTQTAWSESDDFATGLTGGNP